MKRIYILLLLAVGVLPAWGQVDPIYSLYRFNPQNITPAHVGGYEGTEITVMNRQQWMGIEGAPKTMGITANMKWGKQKGLGLVGLLDEAGPMKTVHVGLDFAYHVRLNEAWSFSGGIENITDQRYRPYSSGITAPGRNFILAVRTAF